MRQQKQTIRDIDVQGKRVFLRVDYNVQFVNGNGQPGTLLDDHRLRESVATIWALQGAGAKVIICSHRGRPNGQVVEELRNAPVAEHLSTLVNCPVRSIPECVGPVAEQAVAEMQPGDLLLLENVRFHAEEEANDPQFAKQLASLADVYVSDAFGTAHRAHASVVGVPQIIPGVAGLLLEREIKYLSVALQKPERPFTVILGGAKIADKIGILRHFCEHADIILVGGGIANTFLKAQGIDIADSLVENSRIDEALEVMRLAANRDGVRLMLPRDAIIADNLGENVRAVSVNRIPPGFRILDIGPQTIEDFREALQESKTVVWNGPVGFFERDPFDRGTIEMAKVLGEIDAVTVVGGGETAAAVARAGMQDRVTHVSTGGGASRAMLQGTPLPGVEVLQNAK